MAKKIKYDRGFNKRYETLKRNFYKEKARNNIYSGVRLPTKKEFYGWNVIGDEDGKHSALDVIKAFKILKTKKDEKALLESYNKMLKDRSKVDEKSYWGVQSKYTDFTSLAKHRTISGILGDSYALHYVIQYRINSGESKSDVLEDLFDDPNY